MTVTESQLDAAERMLALRQSLEHHASVNDVDPTTHIAIFIAFALILAIGAWAHAYRVGEKKGRKEAMSDLRDRYVSQEFVKREKEEAEKVSIEAAVADSNEAAVADSGTAKADSKDTAAQSKAPQDVASAVLVQPQPFTPPRFDAPASEPYVAAAPVANVDTRPSAQMTEEEFVASVFFDDDQTVLHHG